MKVDVLGVEYTIEYRQLGDEGIDGFCDSTSKHIVLRDDNKNGLENFAENQRKQLRHELVHAFLHESGLSSNFQHCNEFGHDETMVDWIAIQFPKILKTFRAVGAL